MLQTKNVINTTMCAARGQTLELKNVTISSEISQQQLQLTMRLIHGINGINVAVMLLEMLCSLEQILVLKDIILRPSLESFHTCASSSDFLMDTDNTLVELHSLLPTSWSL